MRQAVEDENKQKRQALEDESAEKFMVLEEESQSLVVKRDNLEDAFKDEMKAQVKELEDQKDQLRGEKMAPLEAEAKELDAQLEAKWSDLDALYEQQSKLTSQLEELERRVRDLDRQAETGLINVISGALENVKELEKGKVSSFESFLPQLGTESKESSGN